MGFLLQFFANGENESAAGTAGGEIGVVGCWNRGYSAAMP
jgi:hypothetical protein